MIYAKILMKGLGKLLLVLFALAMSVYVLLWAINLKDEAPSAESLQLQQMLQAQVPVPDQDNSYVYYAKHHAKSLNLPDALQTFLRCEPALCLRQWQASKTELLELIKSQHLTLDAYQAILAFPEWQTPEMLVTSKIIPYSPLIEMQKLYLLDTWLSIQEGVSTDAKIRLEQDLGFWRRVLRSANNPFYKRIAAYRIEEHFTYAELFKPIIAAEVYQQVVPALWLQPFSEAELSMKLAMAGEWRTNVDALDTIIRASADDVGLLERFFVRDLWLPFIQPQAVSNTFARLNIACAEQQSAEKIVNYPWYSWLYNPMGKVFTTIGIDICLEHNKHILGLESKRLRLING